jgi:hypothetical protein
MVGLEYRWSSRDSSPIIEGMGWFDLASNCTSTLISRWKGTDGIGWKRSRTLHRGLSICQGQDRSLNLRRSRIIYPNRPLCHSRNPASCLVHQQTIDIDV